MEGKVSTAKEFLFPLDTLPLPSRMGAQEDGSMTILVDYMGPDSRTYQVQFSGEAAEAAFAAFLRVLGAHNLITVEANR
jgi:hypothetical protein